MTTLTSLSSQPRIPNGFSILLRGVVCLGFRVMGSLPQQWRSRWTRTSKMTQQLYETTIWSLRFVVVEASQGYRGITREF